jgi:transcriptional regulator of arginine metabolism
MSGPARPPRRPARGGLDPPRRLDVLIFFIKNINSSGSGGLRRRHEILRVVREGAVRSQEEIQRRLRRRGIAVAQPTLSRDLRALGLAKTPAGYVTSGGVVFVPAQLRHQVLDRLVAESVLSVQAAASLVVIRTPPAGAHPLARALDEAELAEVVGTVAGDDTVFVATPSPAAARRLQRRLRIALPTPPAAERVHA